LLDITGPLDILAGASALLPLSDGGLPAYQVEIVAHRIGPVATSSGIKIVAERPYADVTGDDVDTVMIAGGLGFEAVLADEG
jgi:hypothetical protein